MADENKLTDAERRHHAEARILVNGPVEVLYDPRGPVTVSPEVRETTSEEYERFRAQRGRAKKSKRRA